MRAPKPKGAQVPCLCPPKLREHTARGTLRAAPADGPDAEPGRRAGRLSLAAAGRRHFPEAGNVRFFLPSSAAMALAASPSSLQPAAASSSSSGEEPPISGARAIEGEAADAFSEGLMGLLTPLVHKCDEGVQAALDSQAALSQQIDRVTTCPLPRARCTWLRTLPPATAAAPHI